MNDSQLVRDIKNGSESAINRVIDKYTRFIWYIVDTVLKNATSAEDIEECVADVFLYLWQNSDNFNEQRGNLKTWLSVIAKSKAIDRYRQLSKKVELSLDDETIMGDMGVINEIISSETKHEIIAAINALDEQDREVVIRRYYYQQKPKEIGLIFDMPVKQIENRLYRSKLKLREILTLKNGGN